jgi:signal transduction histidine kinase
LDEIDGLRDLRRLRLVGVLGPVVFLVGFEAIRIFAIDTWLQPPASNLAAGTLGVVAALAFGILIFFHIGRAQRSILQRNHDLAVINRVAAASRGELDVDAALRSSLEALVEATGAREARAVVRPLDSQSGLPTETIHAPADRAGDALTGPVETLELPLSANGTSIGHLDLRVPAELRSSLPAPEAMRAMADQLATTLHIGQLVTDLHSRRADGHVFYQALLQASNQAPLAVSLATVIDGARDRLSADESRICLTRRVLDALELDPAAEAGITGGVVCPTPAAIDGTGGDVGAMRLHECPIGTTEDGTATLRAPLWASDELIGDIWVARHDGRPFSQRDRAYLLTLAGIATIAIVSARARQQERHGAVLAERDRIARELHDSLAQVLGSTHLRLRHLLLGPELAERPTVAAELEALADVAQEAYRDVREAILGLREASRPRDFLEAIGAYIDKYSLLSGIEVLLETSLEHQPVLSAGSEIQLLRVVQEALTNVRKHAQATTARVRIADSPPDRLMVVIEDDGRGFDPEHVQPHRDGGYGLQTMRERMELAGGSLRVDSSPNNGTRVIAVVPATMNGRTPAVLADHR